MKFHKTLNENDLKEELLNLTIRVRSGENLSEELFEFLNPLTILGSNKNYNEFLIKKINHCRNTFYMLLVELIKGKEEFRLIYLLYLILYLDKGAQQSKLNELDLVPELIFTGDYSILDKWLNLSELMYECNEKYGMRLLEVYLEVWSNELIIKEDIEYYFNLSEFKSVQEYNFYWILSLYRIHLGVLFENPIQNQSLFWASQNQKLKLNLEKAYSVLINDASLLQTQLQLNYKTMLDEFQDMAHLKLDLFIFYMIILSNNVLHQVGYNEALDMFYSSLEFIEKEFDPTGALSCLFLRVLIKEMKKLRGVYKMMNRPGYKKWLTKYSKVVKNDIYVSGLEIITDEIPRPSRQINFIPKLNKLYFFHS